jgi:hypothetical protein
MLAMTKKEAQRWCTQEPTGLRLTVDDELRYRKQTQHRFFIKAPEEHRKINFLALQILAFRGEGYFGGGMLWLRRWSIGSPQLVRTGWLILEGVRRSRGELRSLDMAPAQFFREDEFVVLQAFLIQTIAYGWVADFVPCSGRFFLHFKDNRQICFTAESAGTLKELRAEFQSWNPTNGDPMLVKMKSFRKERARRGRKKL